MKKKLFLIIIIIINLLIWINSLMPANISSEQSSFIVNIFYPLFKNIISVESFSLLIRKLAHFTEYFILGIFLTLFYLNNNFKYNKIIPLIHGLLVAILDETIQIFVPGRSGQITDILIDFSGVFLAFITVITIVTIIKNKKTF